MQVMFNHFPGVYPSKVISPYEVETVGNVKYTRYTDGKHCTDLRRGTIEDEKILIFRETTITESGKTTVRYEKAWDLWANRASASTVWRPVNSPIGGEAHGMRIPGFG